MEVWPDELQRCADLKYLYVPDRPSRAALAGSY